MDHRRRGFRGPARLYEPPAVFPQVFHPHEEDQGAGVLPQGRPGNGAGLFGGVFVAGDEGHQGGVAPVGHRDAGVGRHRHRRGHPGDHLEGDAGRGQLFRFFAAPAKDKGVAALEAHHREPGPGPFHQQLVDAALGHRVGPGLLAHIEQFRPRRGLFQEFRAGQLVVDHDIGPAQ